MKLLPSRSRGAGEVSREEGRVRVCGTVVSVEPGQGKLVLDDGGTSIEVFLNNPSLREALGTYRPGDQLVAIGWASGQGLEGDIIRRTAGYQPSRYKQVMEVWKNVQGENE